MLLKVVLGALLLQFGVGIILYFRSRRTAQCVVREFTFRASKMDAQIEALGTAVAQLTARAEFLDTAVSHFRNRVEVINDDSTGLMHAAERKLSLLQQQLTTISFSLDGMGTAAHVAVDGLNEIVTDGFRDVSRKLKVPLRAYDRGRTTLIVVLGQSSAANCGAGHYSSIAHVDNFNLYDGQCYRATDPLLGASGIGANFAVRLGDILVQRGLFDRVIIAPIARAGSTVEQWAQQGPFNHLIPVLVRRLNDAGMTPDFILWQQGIGNSGAIDFAGGTIYRKNLLEVVATFRALGVNAPFFVALESGNSEGDPSQGNIRTGQRTAANEKIGTFLGPDIDLIGSTHRQNDRCHFKESGLAIAATMWADTLSEFMRPYDWAAAVARAWQKRPAFVVATRYLRGRQTGSRPVDLQCDDGATYVVKGLRNDDPKQGRMLFNEYVVARLGTLLGAPIPPPQLVMIPAELISSHPVYFEGLGHIRPGMAHGSLFNERLGERVDKIRYGNSNKARFACLAILYGWTQANDWHFLYDHRHRVFSADHGNFFPGGPHWSTRDLTEIDHPKSIHMIIEACELAENDLAEACAPLQAISQERIAEIVGTAPNEWGVTLDERVALARFLWARQLQLLAIYDRQPEMREGRLAAE